MSYDISAISLIKRYGQKRLYFLKPLNVDFLIFVFLTP